MSENKDLKLIRMNEVEAKEVNWLWYPYIPFGKITVVQGDPGDEDSRRNSLWGPPEARSFQT